MFIYIPKGSNFRWWRVLECPEEITTIGNQTAILLTVLEWDSNLNTKIRIHLRPLCQQGPSFWKSEHDHPTKYKLRPHLGSGF